MLSASIFNLYPKENIKINLLIQTKPNYAKFAFVDSTGKQSVDECWIGVDIAYITKNYVDKQVKVRKFNPLSACSLIQI